MMRAILISLPLCFTLACAVTGEDETTNEESADLGTVCTVFRPMQWGTAGNICVERKGPTVFLEDGEQFETFATPAWNRGDGYLVLGCSISNGLFIVDSFCQQ